MHARRLKMKADRHTHNRTVTLVIPRRVLFSMHATCGKPIKPSQKTQLTRLPFSRTQTTHVCVFSCARMTLTSTS